MKKLFVFLFVTILTSCGAELEPPKSNTEYKNIIGVTKKIDDLEIAQYDFPQGLEWPQAKSACEALGNGWRLPTKSELNVLYQNKDMIGGWKGNSYYSSEEYDNDFVWRQRFDDGSQLNDGHKYLTNNVRAVRSF